MATVNFRDPVSGNLVPLLDNGLKQAGGDSRFINLSGDTVVDVRPAAPTAGNHAVTRDYLNWMIPPGVIGMINSNTIPPGWLLCDGGSYAKATYPDLYAVVGGTFGSTPTNFTVPNLKARACVGVNTGEAEFSTLGEIGGATYHTLTTAQVANASGVMGWHGGGSRTSFYGATGTFYPVNYIGAYGRPQYWIQAASNIGGSNHAYSGGGGAHENRQWSTIINHVIKT